MQIQIHPQDGTPLYQQIVNQVKYLVAAGRLQPGDEVPPIRVLAEQLTVNPNTVARAYLELERAGIVFKRHGTGTYIGEGRSLLPRRERVKILTRHADTLLTEALNLGIDFAEVAGLLQERYQALQPQTPR